MNAYRGIDKLKPQFKEKVEAWLEEVEPYGVFLTETWRSTDRQKMLFKDGKSFLDGEKRISMHQKGLAVDIAFRGAYLYPEDPNIWRKVADSAKKYGIDWGFDLWNWDRPHFQDSGKPLSLFEKVKIAFSVKPKNHSILFLRKARQNIKVVKTISKSDDFDNICNIIFSQMDKLEDRL